jgi:hypothetical protein
MKNVFRKLFGLIIKFFNKMVNQEAERVTEIYRQIF